MKIFRRSAIHYLLNKSSLLIKNFFLHALSSFNVNLLILHLNVQMLQLLQIFHLPLLSLIPHLRTLLVSLTMQGWRNCTRQACTKASKGIRLFVMCLKSRSSTGTLGKRVLPLRGNSMLMELIGSLSSIPKPHGLLQRDLQLIHLLYLALHVNLLILLMSHLTPTINCSKIRMVRYLLDMLGLTAGTVPLWRKSGLPKRTLKIFRWMSSWHRLWRTGTRDQFLHMDPSPLMDRILHLDQNPHVEQKSSYEHHRANTYVARGKSKGYEYVHYSSNHYVHTSLKNYSYAYPNSSYVKQNGLASMPPFSYGARRVMNSLPPLQMWVVKKKN